MLQCTHMVQFFEACVTGREVTVWLKFVPLQLRNSLVFGYFSCLLLRYVVLLCNEGVLLIARRFRVIVLCITEGLGQSTCWVAVPHLSTTSRRIVKIGAKGCFPTVSIHLSTLRLLLLLCLA
ncbi:hypothetical protein F2P79_010269 [Pimephales promelas]|nr:hypothetical protein F2P79_010269 [Pimephales promelas]